MKTIYFIVFITCIFFSCNKTVETDKAFVSTLKEKTMGDLQYSISLPEDYTIEEKQAEDFSVFYFYPADTSTDAEYTCGIYFGNYPSKFEPKGESCTSETINSEILGSVQEWELFRCSDICSAQIVTDSKSSEGWCNKIHAFGHADNEKALNKIFGIFSTLRKK